VDAWAKRDPLVLYQAWLEKQGLLDKAALGQMQQRAAQEVDEATAYAESAPRPDPESALEGVMIE
jgi:2-oxoisovalerate dehydrogenase E1 component alpha subunit